MTPLRIIMLSYERGFLNPSSEARARLEKLASSDTRVTAIVLSRTEKKIDKHGDVRVIGLAGNPVARFFAAYRAAVREIKRSRKAGETPVLSAQDPFVAGKIAFLASRMTNVPYEIQEHADFFSGAWVREMPVIRHVWAWAGDFFLRRADGVRVVSERVRDHVIARGVKPERISVIPVAQDVAPLLSRPPSESNGIPTIVVPCRFVKQKGLDVLIDALALLAKQNVAFHVRIIGEGAEGPKIAERASRLGVRDRITFEQWSAPDAIWKNAELFVLSSRYEGWGRTIVEAMAAGVPVVATDTGCVGSFFRPQIDGRVVQPEDATALAAAIREQLVEPERRTWMAAQARERAASFPSGEELITKQRDAWKRIVSETRESLSTSQSAWKFTALLVGFSVIVHGISVALFWHSLGTNREWGFFTQIQHFFQGYGYSYAAQAGCVSAYRSPGFLFFLTAVYGLFGFANFFAQAVIQNLIAVLLTYLVYRLGWRMANDRRVGWIAGLLVTLHPYTFYHYTQYYHTVLSGLFLVSLLLSLFALERARRMRWAAWTGVMIAALAYVQGTILPATVFLSLWLLWRWRHVWQRAIIAIAIMAVVSVGLIAPWTYRNWQTFHRFVPLTTDVGLPLYKANTENYEVLLLNGYPHEVLSEEYKPGDPSYVKYHYLPEAQALLERNGGVKDAAYWTEWHPSEPQNVATCAELPSVPEPEMDAHWKALAWDWYRNNLSDGLRLSAEKAAVFWTPVLYPSVRYGAPWAFGNEGVLAMLARLSYTGYVVFAELFALIGLVMLARRKRLRVAAPLLIVMAVYTIMHSIIAPYTKYRIPLDNLVAVFAAVGLIAAWDVFRARRASKKS